MGGTQSRAVIESLSDVLTNISMRTVQDCVVQVDQEQELMIRNTGWTVFGTFNVEQSTDIDSRCFADLRRQTIMQNEIINAIKQTSTADGIALLSAFGRSYSEATTNLNNIIRNNLTMENIQRSYNILRQRQTVGFDNSGVMIGTRLDMRQGGHIFAASTLEILDNAGVFSTIANHVDQEAAATNGLFGNLFGNLFGGGFIMIIIIVAIIAAVIYFWPSSSKNEKFGQFEIPDSPTLPHMLHDFTY